MGSSKKRKAWQAESSEVAARRTAWRAQAAGGGDPVESRLQDSLHFIWVSETLTPWWRGLEGLDPQGDPATLSHPNLQGPRLPR